MTIVTPIAHMEKAWKVRELDVRGELSLRGSDWKMNPGFHFYVIQTVGILYLDTGVGDACILVWIFYMCGFVWHVHVRAMCVC